MKKAYLTAETEVITFKLNDIITTSSGSDPSDNGDYDPSSDLSNSGWTGW